MHPNGTEPELDFSIATPLRDWILILHYVDFPSLLHRNVVARRLHEPVELLVEVVSRRRALGAGAGAVESDFTTPSLWLLYSRIATPALVTTRRLRPGIGIGLTRLSLARLGLARLACPADTRREVALALGA
jgi:hypothetical protein